MVEENTDTTTEYMIFLNITSKEGYGPVNEKYLSRMLREFMNTHLKDISQPNTGAYELIRLDAKQVKTPVVFEISAKIEKLYKEGKLAEHVDNINHSIPKMSEVQFEELHGKIPIHKCMKCGQELTGGFTEVEKHSCFQIDRAGDKISPEALNTSVVYRVTQKTRKLYAAGLFSNPAYVLTKRLEKLLNDDNTSVEEFVKQYQNDPTITHIKKKAVSVDDTVFMVTEVQDDGSLKVVDKFISKPDRTEKEEAMKNSKDGDLLPFLIDAEEIKEPPKSLPISQQDIDELQTPVAEKSTKVDWDNPTPEDLAEEGSK